MRIAMISTEKLPVPNIKGGAIQTYLTGILEYLPKLANITIFCPEDNNLPRKTDLHNCEIFRLPGESWDTYFANVLGILATKKYDIIHVFNRPQAVKKLGKLCGSTPITLSVHSNIIEEGLTGEELRDLFSLYRGIVTVSKYLSDKIISIYPEGIKKIRHIYEGVNTDEFSPNEKNSATGRNWDIKQEQVILSVGRLTQEKGMHLLVQAFPEVLKFFPKCILILIGSSRFIDKSGYLEMLEETVNFPRERLQLLQDVAPQKIHEFYSVADIFVNPCQWEEPLGRVHYEAMAAGLPIITTPKGGNAEVIKDDYNGIIVKNFQQAKGFSDSIINLLRNEDLLKSLSHNARNLATQHFTWKRVAFELKSYFQEIIDNNQG